MNSFESEKTKALHQAVLKISKLKDEVSRLKKTSQDEDLAVIGMGCIFPGGANSPEEFWQGLLNGYDGISRVPIDRWDADAYFSKDPSEPGKINTKRGGFIDIDVANFDANFFGISPKEAASMDPQQRLLLEVTWQALENAAIDPHSLKETAASVYIGSCLNDYQLLLNQGSEKDINAYRATGNSSAVMAGRIAYVLGLEGPALSCDTACSSSLVAVHLACSALKNRETNLAIVGGVNLILSPTNSIIFSKANMLSEDGYCKTFDEEADGYVRGEGCGVVIIKRRSDALAHHDNILAIIKGTAINQDGASGGLTVPSISAQKNVLELALNNAKIKPHEIDFIETHGTGTALGDPIEIQSISHVFKNRDRALVLGSVKVNIGHLEGAAAIAGLIKTILSLQHQQIPKHRNFKKLNPMINLDEIKGVIPLEAKKWPHDPQRVRRAGISSFGFSGTNAHMIVEEAPAPLKTNAAADDRNYLFCFSAKTETSLKNYLKKFIRFLDEAPHSHYSPRDISYTLNTGRAQFNHRLAFFAASIESLKEKIKAMDHVTRENLQDNTDADRFAQRFILGEKLEFSSMYSEPCRKLQLPTYAFLHQHYWKKPDTQNFIPTELKNLDFFDMIWQPLNLLHTESLRNKNIVFCDNELTPLRRLTDEDRRSVQGFFLVAQKQFLEYEDLLSFVQNLIIRKHELPCGLTIITSGALATQNRTAPYQLSPSYVMLTGLIKALAWEAPYLNAKLIDVDDLSKIAALKNELPISTSPFLSFDQGIWYQPEIIKLSPNDIKKTKPFNPEGTHWITGGTGSLGLAIASELIKLGVRSIILSSRQGAAESVQEWLKQHQKKSLSINIVQADVTRKDQLKALLQNQLPKNKPLKAVYHLAGTNIQKPIIEFNLKQIEEIMAAKTIGAQNLSELTCDYDLNYFVLFSSIVSFTGSSMQLPYVMGNTYLDLLAKQREDENKPCLLINWGPWSHSTMTEAWSQSSLKERMADSGLISMAHGLDSFTQLLQSARPNATVINPSFLPFMFSFFSNPQAKWLGAFLELIEKKEEPITAHAMTDLRLVSAQERKNKLIALVSQTAQKSLELPEPPPKNLGFFDLGMDSLMSVEMIQKIQQSLGIPLKPTAAFDYPSITALANYLDELLSHIATDAEVNDIKKVSSEAIAIIGMSCQFPGGANNLEKFWDRLYEGKDCISEPPKSRLAMAAHIDKEQQQHKKKYPHRSGFIDDIDLFDADFFNISPREAESLDPQQRLVLENAWHALEHAGIDPLSLKGKQVGIFIGISQSEYASFVLNQIENKDVYHATGTALNVCAGRLAYTLGTQGPTMAIDTACSSSLVAVHEACNSLKLGECELAIVVGVNAIIDPNVLITLTHAAMLSPDGACKTFDESANGYVRGEGCGVVILQHAGNLSRHMKPLALIKASHINQDGATSGLTVPNGLVQKNLILKTLEKAKLKPEDIDYIETHGSGTKLGDPIEIGAIHDVFSGRKKPLILGTVKTNIGHLESASGIAGLIKTVLSLQHQWIPKHLHLNKINPLIDLSAIPALIPKQGLAFAKSETRVRRAGISSFGFSGTNAHVILEEAPEGGDEDLASPSSRAHLFLVSAKTRTALQRLLLNYMAYLQETKESLTNICFTAATGRSHFRYRLAFKISSIDDLITKMALVQEINPCGHDEMEPIQSQDIDTLMAAYLIGHAIDWVYFYTLYNGPLKKVPLPHYSFDKKHYWLDAKPEKPDPLLRRHPLLLNQSYSHHHQAHLFTSKLSLNDPSFVKDHTIYNLPVIAGATYVSMMISFVVQILEQKHGFIDHLVFTQPLIVDQDRPRTLQLLVKESDNSQASFELLSYFDKTPKNHISHAQGMLRASSSFNTTATSIDALILRLKNTYLGTHHQKNAAKAQLHLGPHFHWIDEIYYDEKELLAFMRAPKPIEETGYDLYPGFIDASFQAMMTWIDFNDEEATLPIPLSIEKISFKAPKNFPKFVHIKKIGEGQRANIRYLDEQGDEMVLIEGFTAREVTQTALLKILNLQYQNQAPSYFIDWQRVSENAFSMDRKAVRDMELTLISPAPMALKNLSQALSPMKTTVAKSLEANLAAEHVLYIYPIQRKTGQSDDLYMLHKAVQACINNPKIKSLGVITGSSMAHGLVSGYWKTLMQEWSGKNLYLIESPIFYDEHLLSDLILARCLGRTDENHVALRKGTYFVPRLLTDVAFEARQPVLPLPIGPSVLQSVHQQLDTLAWTKSPHTELLDHQVRIQIKITSLNFRDVLKLMGIYPGKSEWHFFEHAGLVVETGRLVNTIRVGDKVITLTEKNFCSESIADANQIIKIPSDLGLKEACSIPAVFLTAFGCLYELAGLKKDDKVLIHAASGGVGLAAIQLAKLKGATILVTTSDAKISYLKSLGIQYIYNSRRLGFANEILKDTHGEGVDIILNSLTSEGFIDESLRALRQGGTFIEMGKINIWSAEEMSTARPDVKYHIYALDERMALAPEKTSQQLSELLALHQQGQCQPLPNTVFDLRHVVQAFRYLQSGQHIGKVLIKHPEPFCYHADKTYLITGGLGGLGQMLIEHLLQQGVKNFAVLGRRPISSLPESLDALVRDGATINYYPADVSDAPAVLKIMQQINQSSQPLAGVFHLAGLLKDKTIDNLSLEDFNVSLKAKVLGSLALHKATKDLDLDCFVLFSSIASIFGSPGQANYAAANAFMDRLAEKRAQSGRCALSINWGPFSEAGMAKEHIKQHQLRGIHPLHRMTAFKAMDALLERPFCQALIADFDWQKASSLTHNQKLLSLVHESHKKSTIDLISILLQTPFDQREQVLSSELKKRVASVLYIEDENELDEHKGFFELGLDSLMSVDLWARLQSMLGDEYPLSKTLLFEKNSLYKLRSYFQNELFPSLFQSQDTEEALLDQLEALLND